MLSLCSLSLPEGKAHGSLLLCLSLCVWTPLHSSLRLACAADVDYAPQT